MDMLEERSRADSTRNRRFEWGGSDTFWQGKEMRGLEFTAVIRRISTHEDEIILRGTSETVDVMVGCQVSYVIRRLL